MIAQTYTFRDMPQKIRENANGEKDRFIRGIEADLKYEFESSLFPPTLLAANMDVTGYDMLVTFWVDEADARFLEIALHNLYSAQHLQTV